MAWISPITFVDGDPLTAAQINNFLQGNLNACAPGIATRAGRLIASGGKNVVVERQWARGWKPDVITIDGEWPGDPDVESDIGPTITFEHGGTYMLMYDAMVRKLSGTGYMNYAPEITEGPGSDFPDVQHMAVRSGHLNVYVRTGSSFWVTGVEPGITTVTMKYGSTPGSVASGDFQQRRLSAICF